MFSWGNNDQGQLGVGDVTLRDSISSALNIGAAATAITAGAYHNCILLQDGKVACWGGNQYGQLGLGHNVSIGDKAALAPSMLPSMTLPLPRPAIGIASAYFSNKA